MELSKISSIAEYLLRSGRSLVNVPLGQFGIGKRKHPTAPAPRRRRIIVLPLHDRMLSRLMHDPHSLPEIPRRPCCSLPNLSATFEHLGTISSRACMPFRIPPTPALCMPKDIRGVLWRCDRLSPFHFVYHKKYKQASIYLRTFHGTLK